jgi:Fe-S-cluster containining protein
LILGRRLKCVFLGTKVCRTLVRRTLVCRTLVRAEGGKPTGTSANKFLEAPFINSIVTYKNNFYRRPLWQL